MMKAKSDDEKGIFFIYFLFFNFFPFSLSPFNVRKKSLSNGIHECAEILAEITRKLMKIEIFNILA